jgi:hypothetical protein
MAYLVELTAHWCAMAQPLRTTGLHNKQQSRFLSSVSSGCNTLIKTTGVRQIVKLGITADY